MTAPHFETRDVARTYRSRGGADVCALDGVSTEVERGGFLVITGPSGSGKTTLLALLAALDRPTAGAVLYDGRDLGGASGAERARVRRRIGIVFQASPMVRGLPLWENVTYPLVPRGVSTGERRLLGAELLERVGLEERVNALPSELSGGELRRAGIARALAGEPEAVLADEPTADLDRETAAGIAALFREEHAAGMTIVVATHDESLITMATQECRLD